jgi:hypothetical protein
MRPLTNSNVVVDFFRHVGAPYFVVVTDYLRGADGAKAPDYALQYRETMAYYRAKKTLHRYHPRPLESHLAVHLHRRW